MDWVKHDRITAAINDESQQEYDDRNERMRKFNLKDDNWLNRIEPLPIESPIIEISGTNRDQFIVLPNGTIDGFKLNCNNFTESELWQLYEQLKRCFNN